MYSQIDQEWAFILFFGFGNSLSFQGFRIFLAVTVYSQMRRPNFGQLSEHACTCQFPIPSNHRKPCADDCLNRHRLVFTILSSVGKKNDRVGEFCRLKHLTTFPIPNMFIAPTQQSHDAAKQPFCQPVKPISANREFRNTHAL